MNKIVSAIVILCLSLIPSSSIDHTIELVPNVECKDVSLTQTPIGSQILIENIEKELELQVNNKLEKLEKINQLEQEFEMLKNKEKELSDRAKLEAITKEDVEKEEEISQSNSNRWNITLTSDDIDLLAKILWLEARGESDLGKQAVVEVVFNRMIHSYFQGSLYEVLSAKNQFSTWKNRNNAKPTEGEYGAIKKVLNGETNILSMDTVYFSTSPRNNNVTAHIGCHYFCR